MALRSKRSLTKEDEETVKKLNRLVKKEKGYDPKEYLPLRINPRIIAEWKADGGTHGTYKTPEDYYDAYYGEGIDPI